MSLARCTLHYNIARLLLSLLQQYIKWEIFRWFVIHWTIAKLKQRCACVCVCVHSGFSMIHQTTIHTVIFYRLNWTMTICMLKRRHISKWYHRKFQNQKTEHIQTQQLKHVCIAFNCQVEFGLLIRPNTCIENLLSTLLFVLYAFCIFAIVKYIWT